MGKLFGKISLFVVILTLSQLGRSEDLSKIHPWLQKSLQSKSEVNVFISLRHGGTLPVLRQLESSFAFKSATTHSQRTTLVSKALRTHAETSQRPVLEFIRTMFPAVQVRAFWITNQIYLKKVNRDIIYALASLHHVFEIQEEQETHIRHFYEESSTSVVSESRQAEEVEWGLERMRVPDVWAMEGGNRGEGLVVGNIDTGVRGTHQLLTSKWVGLENNGWFDPEGHTPNPHDVYDHGRSSFSLSLRIGAS